jgi:hypothetical protein
MIATSDVRKAGSIWEYRIAPVDGGSRVDFTLVHHPRGPRGWFLAAFLPLGGRRFFGKSIAALLRSLAAEG